MLELKPLHFLQFDYINWRGVKGERTVQIYKVYYGETEYHPEQQWLLEALDVDKKEKRVFAMKDMSNVRYF